MWVKVQMYLTESWEYGISTDLKPIEGIKVFKVKTLTKKEADKIMDNPELIKNYITIY
jgi:arsenate reductase-like glutaredoxin family protein